MIREIFKAVALIWRLIVKIAVLIDRIDDAWLALKALLKGDDDDDESEKVKGDK